MPVAIIGPKFYGWDRNGKPLAFGKLYTYEARTNTPKDTYQSEDQIVANSNPVILNGEGYANVYLDGSYKVVLKDSEDNEIWSADPVTASTAEEWVNCHSASYLSSTSFKIIGNVTDKYDEGRKVRIDNNETAYSFSTISSSIFAGGDTTVVVSDAVILVGIIGSCVSIIGADSGLNDDDVKEVIKSQSPVFDFETIEEAVNSSDATRVFEGATANLQGLNSSDDSKGALWDVVLSSGIVAGSKYVVESIAIPSLTFVMRVGFGVESQAYYQEKLTAVKREMEDGNTIKIVCLGDSLTAGAYPSALQEFLRGYYRNSNITVIAEAFSGFRSDQILDKWPSSVTPNDPDLVVLMAGMNDALQYETTTIDTFTDSMLAMYTLAKEEGRGIVSMNITPAMVHDTDVKRYIDLYRRSGMALADRQEVPNLDVNRIMLNLIQKQSYNWHDLYSDFIHTNERGGRELAGAVFCYMLASEKLTMSVGSKVPPIEPYFVYEEAANVTYEDALAPNSTNARITPSLDFYGAYMWFFVEDYQFSNLALECTRENHATKLPKIFINNEEIENIVFTDFLLGTQAGASFKTNGAPIIACRIKPGLNKIKIFSDATSTAEFSTASIVTDEGVYTDLAITETFRDNILPHSYSDNRDSEPKVLNETGKSQIVNAGKFVTAGNMTNPTNASQLYRIRCLPTDGFTLSMMRRNEFAEEYRLPLDIKFEQVAGDVDTTTTITNTDGTVTQIDYVKQLNQTLNEETRFDILVTTLTHGGGNTTVYRSGQLVATIPFAIGASQLIALSAGAASSMINHLSTFSPGSPLFGEVDGENWIDFTTPASKMTINGVVETI